MAKKRFGLVTCGVVRHFDSYCHLQRHPANDEWCKENEITSRAIINRCHQRYLICYPAQGEAVTYLGIPHLMAIFGLIFWVASNYYRDVPKA